VSAEDSEIFFGPIGHTEKCVAVAVNEVAQASDRLRPLSPLSASQMAELCREAYTIAYQISHADRSRLPSSRAAMLSDAVSRVNPVDDLPSGAAENDRGPMTSFDKTLTSNAAEDFTSTQKLYGRSGDKIIPVDLFESVQPSTESTVPEVVEFSSGVAEAETLDKTFSNNTAEDLISSTATLLSAEVTANSFEGVLLPVGGPALTEIVDLNSNATEADKVPTLDATFTTTTSEDLLPAGAELSGGHGKDGMSVSSNSFEGKLSSSASAVPDVVVDVARGTDSVDKTLSSNTSDDAASCGTEMSSRLLDDAKKLSGNSFGSLLTSLGSALPVIDPGSLTHDEHGVVKFTAAAANRSSAANDASAKCHTGIPTTSGLRRAFSAKSSTSRPSGIPMKGLAVRHLFVIKY